MIKHFNLVGNLFLFLILSLFLSSCSSYKEVTIQGIENFSIKKINKKEMQTEIVVKIKNPNNFGFYIYSGKANIYLSNIPLGKAVLSKKVYIAPNSTETYPFLLNTSFDKISLQDVISNFSLSGIGKIKIDGHVKVGKFLIRRKIKINYEGSPLHFSNFNFSN